MTTTKVVFLIAAILPFGFMLLAAALLLRKIYLRQREKQAFAKILAA